MYEKIEFYLKRKLTEEEKKEITIIGDFETGKATKITRWNLPEPQPTLEQLGNLTKPNELIVFEEIQKNLATCRKFLEDTDFKVLRHIRELSLNIITSLSEQEYLDLEQERQNKVEYIRQNEQAAITE